MIISLLSLFLSQSCIKESSLALPQNPKKNDFFFWVPRVKSSTNDRGTISKYHRYIILCACEIRSFLLAAPLHLDC